MLQIYLYLNRYTCALYQKYLPLSKQVHACLSDYHKMFESVQDVFICSTTKHFPCNNTNSIVSSCLKDLATRRRRTPKNSKVPILSKKGYLMYLRWRKPVLEKGYVESPIPEDYSFFPLIQTIDYKKFEMYLYQYTKGSWVQFKDQILPNISVLKSCN